MHLEHLYAFYGEHVGVRVARKHLGWYRAASLSPEAGAGAVPSSPSDDLFRELRLVDSAPLQHALARGWFESLSVARHVPVDAVQARDELGVNGRVDGAVGAGSQLAAGTRLIA